MSPGELQSGYVLHRRPYRESSLLIELFTRQQGRIGMVARGARRARARRPAFPWQPFQLVLVSWSGRGELKNLRAVEAVGRTMMLPVRTCMAALYVHELLLNLLRRQDPHPRLFDIYQHTLGALPQDVAGTLRNFEMELLAELGYALVLDRDWRTGERIHAGRNYYYRAEHGPSLAPPGGDCLQVRGETLCTLAAGQPPSTGGEHERMRLLQYNLRHHLGGRELSSRLIYRELLQCSAAADSGADRVAG